MQDITKNKNTFNQKYFHHFDFFYCQYTAILFTFLRTTKYSCLKKCCKILECVYHLQKKII